MKLDREQLKTYVHEMISREHEEAGEEGVNQTLDQGKKIDLSDVLRDGGAILFPHAGFADCGHQIAAAVHACLDCGADKVLAIGVLHALSDELEEARSRVATGNDPSAEDSWGIQGPELDGRDDWRYEFSLLHFKTLWDVEVQRRGITPPELILRYPYLAGGKPEMLPGIGELQELAQDSVIVTTADAFHHGIGYGESPQNALAPERGGLELAERTIQEGLDILGKGDYWRFNQHCVDAKSDGRDAGQVVRYLLGPMKGSILDLTYSDTTKMYDAPPPTWVAAALIKLQSQ